jgi:hypothetical protein
MWKREEDCGNFDRVGDETSAPKGNIQDPCCLPSLARAFSGF